MKEDNSWQKVVGIDPDLKLINPAQYFINETIFLPSKIFFHVNYVLSVVLTIL